ncbi:MAG: cytochrome b [Rhodospirillaceae bacterium]|nr:cytochrome b [Rhodospirillaceae bacterium]
MGNTHERWGWLSKSFHWIIALLIAVIVPVGFIMSATFQLKVDPANAVSLQMDSAHIWLSRIHQTAGLVVLMLVTLRLGWRLSNPGPDIPASLAAYQRVLAKLNHAFLYALLFLIPLSGWASMSAYGEAPTYFFWIEGLPDIVPKVPLSDPFGYGFFASIHRYGIYAGGVLLSLHIIAALWHQFAIKDSVLRRMWPLAS